MSIVVDDIASLSFYFFKDKNDDGTASLLSLFEDSSSTYNTNVCCVLFLPELVIPIVAFDAIVPTWEGLY